jgi:hypothetical protein
MSIQSQAKEIHRLVSKLQNLLKSAQLVAFFKTNPQSTQTILEATQSYQTSRLVLDGLKEALNSEVLPSQEELFDREKDWLEPDDIILGWKGELIESDTSEHESARVIVAATTEGYIWRYLDEEETVTRSPVALDPWYQHIGWQLAEDDIEAQQQAEIDALTQQIAYFENRTFLN